MSSSPQHEPTMEEILASIRKIISEDSTEAQPAAAPEAKPAPAAAPAPAPMMAAPVEADVLELTQEVHDAEPPQAPMPASEPVRAVVPPENDVVFETIEEPAVTSEAPASSHEDIFSDKTRRAMEDTFAHIEPEDEEMPRRPAASPVAPIDGRTVEAVFERAVREAFDPVVNNWLGANAEAVVERMKPLIREWMDDHFPALLEGAVRNEVARVVKARGTKR
ncbi:MAG: DUF2497 domain-containing protein [Alphaproteobacteria bacterium]|nr:DUF2497 domain-containing protein [Alphaproteobacteria bacterium]